MINIRLLPYKKPSNRQDDAQRNEQHSDGKTNIKHRNSPVSLLNFPASPQQRSEHSDYQKMMFKITAITSTTIPSVAGRAYQLFASSCAFSVSEYTNPTKSFSSRGFVTKLITIVTTKQVVHAQIAVQKFCAISLGYVCETG